jgi:organic radical activating enzyme
VDIEGFVRYIKSFNNIIIWGAGFLGTEIGEKLSRLNVNVSTYWDIRSDEIARVNNTPVIKSFSQKYDPHETIFIFCITNSFVGERLRSQLSAEGYNNVLVGEHIYQGLVCEATSHHDFGKCTHASACDAYTCDRNEHFLPRGFADPRWGDDDRLFFRNVTVVINQKCTLKCKYCYSYTNSYPKDLRINFPTARILKDIDLFFDAIDGVKFVPLIGGETFLHPDLNVIARKILEKKNFGILNITTNGVVKIPPSSLDGLADERVQLVFSNYKDSLTSKEVDVYERNIEKVRSHGLRVIASNATPTWSVPSTLSNKYYPLETMIEKRSVCRAPLNCQYLKNGKFFPCTFADTIHNLHLAEYPTDYIELDHSANPVELHNSISNLLRRDHFLSCGHCDGVQAQTGLTAKAGEQGFFDFINQ